MVAALPACHNRGFDFLKVGFITRVHISEFVIAMANIALESIKIKDRYPEYLRNQVVATEDLNTHENRVPEGLICRGVGSNNIVSCCSIIHEPTLEL